MVKFHHCKFKSCIYKVRSQQLLKYHTETYHARNKYKWCFFCRYTTKVQVGHTDKPIVWPIDKCDRIDRPLLSFRVNDRQSSSFIGKDY